MSAVESVWTTSSKVVLNSVSYDDSNELIFPAAVLAKTLNRFCSQRIYTYLYIFPHIHERSHRLVSSLLLVVLQPSTFNLQISPCEPKRLRLRFLFPVLRNFDGKQQETNKQGTNKKQHRDRCPFFDADLKRLVEDIPLVDRCLDS